MSSDTNLTADEIIHLYGLRLKIEHAFKQAVHVIGGFCYHFWMKKMKPLKKRNGDQYFHRETKTYRDAVARKTKAYHVFVLAGMSLKDCSNTSQSVTQSLSGNILALG